MGDDHSDVQMNQFCCEGRELVEPPVRPSVLNDDVPSFLITEITKTHAKCLNSFGQTRSRRRTQ